MLPIEHTRFLGEVSFPDARHGWVVGVNGVIVATTDGGTTWQRQDATVKALPSGYRDTSDVPDRPEAADQQGTPGSVSPDAWEGLSGVSFVDPQHGHVVGLFGTILGTSDGGKTWVAEPTPEPSHFPSALQINGEYPEFFGLSAVTFPDVMHGYAVGGYGNILVTSDAGESWTYRGDSRYGILGDVSFTDPNHGQVPVWFDRYEGAVVTMATADGGQTWVRRKPGDLGESIHNFNWHSVAFVDAMRGYAVSDGGRIVVTTDGGESWKLQRTGAEDLYDVSFWDNSRGIAVGGVQFDDLTSKALVFATDDGGTTWTSRVIPDAPFLMGVDFADRDTAYAVGCVTKVGDRQGACIEGAAVRISFSPPAAVSEPSSSSPPWLPYGAALVVLGGAAVFVMRRR